MLSPDANMIKLQLPHLWRRTKAYMRTVQLGLEMGIDETQGQAVRIQSNGRQAGRTDSWDFHKKRRHVSLAFAAIHVN